MRQEEQTTFLPTPDRPDPLAYGTRLLDIAIRRHKPVAVFGMFSGGHDSLCATHLASQYPAFTAAVHINTGIGIEETREYVRRTSRLMNWPLLEYCAKDLGQNYESLVLEHGFPGPYHHRKMYNRLKERCVRKLVRDHKRTKWERVLLVTGVRFDESTRRMGTVDPINREGARVWVAPLAHFTSLDKNQYIADNALPRNEVVDLLHMSGECLCGAFAHPGELAEIEQWYPNVAEEIRCLERQVRSRGFNWGWEDAPPAKQDPDQTDLFQPLCIGCEHRRRQITEAR